MGANLQALAHGCEVRLPAALGRRRGGEARLPVGRGGLQALPRLTTVVLVSLTIRLIAITMYGAVIVLTNFPLAPTIVRAIPTVHIITFIRTHVGPT